MSRLYPMVTIFDLGLIAVHPESRTLQVANRLSKTPYKALHGKPLREAKAGQRASKAALEKHFATYEDS